MVANNRPSPDRTIEAHWTKLQISIPRSRPKAEILADLRQALTEARLAGDLRPALEVLDEIDSEIADNADHCSPPANLLQSA